MPFYEDVIVGFHGAYAVNHPVQGSCAEVMQIALTRLDQALRDEPDVQIIATVHDEAVLLVPDDAEFSGTHRRHRSAGNDRRLR